MKYTNEKALDFFRDNDLADRLQQVYDQIPSGTCAGCTKCCSEAVNTFFSEYLHVRLNLEAKGLLKAYEKAATAYYLTELVADMKCPLLMTDGLCSAYEARPLPCRVYGHLTLNDYEANYEEIHRNNQAVALALRQDLGIIVPEAVIHKKISFCEAFKSEEPMTLEDRDDLADLLFSVDSRFLAADLLDFDDLNLSLVQWFAYDALGMEEAQQLRVKVAQEISETGNSQTLLQTMVKI